MVDLRSLVLPLARARCKSSSFLPPLLLATVTAWIDSAHYAVINYASFAAWALLHGFWLSACPL